MKTKPTLTVNLHCEEGRGMFQLDLDSFTAAERQFMVRLFGNADSGSKVEFGVGKTEDGRDCMQFTIGIPLVTEVPLAEVQH